MTASKTNYKQIWPYSYVMSIRLKILVGVLDEVITKSLLACLSSSCLAWRYAELESCFELVRRAVFALCYTK